MSDGSEKESRPTTTMTRQRLTLVTGFQVGLRAFNTLKFQPEVAVWTRARELYTKPELSRIAVTLAAAIHYLLNAAVEPPCQVVVVLPGPPRRPAPQLELEAGSLTRRGSDLEVRRDADWQTPLSRH